MRAAASALSAPVAAMITCRALRKRADGHRHPQRGWLRGITCCGAAPRFDRQFGSMWKQRGGVTVRSEPEVRHVQPALQQSCGHLACVAGGDVFRRHLGHGVDRADGGADSIDEGCTEEIDIARDALSGSSRVSDRLVAEPQLDAPPIGAQRRQLRMDRCWCPSTSQRPDGRARVRRDPARAMPRSRPRQAVRPQRDRARRRSASLVQGSGVATR